MSASNVINNNNVNNVRRMIYMKEYSCKPFYATVHNSESVITDYDVFPYPRWFRGVYNSDRPIVAEREAGFRQRDDNCYKTVQCDRDDFEYPNHCFEVACSTIFPCTKDTIGRSPLTEIYKPCINVYR